MKAGFLRNLSQEELTAKLKELRKNLFELNFKRKYGKVERPHLFREYKRDIARILTVLKEKKNESK
ncbi:MAG TPA: 50S ribosomal protein L29 [Candidatus Omnitrophica bacterium]|nr:MAG: 50S ribosomal protein L29 [Candidatus Omnitrophota bacterium]HEC69087.1 50S ribosomal protein L29 [Candidatus Omnitrophota bacterium]